MMLKAAAVAATLLLHAACAHAQTPAGSPVPPAGRGSDSAGGVEVASRSRTTTGFQYGGTVEVAPDGSTRWSDYPVVTAVTPGTPAHKLGLQAGDVILAVNGRDGRETKLFQGDEPGLSYVVRIRRGEEVRELTIVRVLRTPRQ